MFKKSSNSIVKVPSVDEAILENFLDLQPPENATTTIPEFFADREILITGGSGFLGQALIEKILRSCPKVGKIFLLLRSSKGKSIEERLKIITKNSVFDTMRIIDENFERKLIPIKADMSELELGMSPEDVEKLKNVSIVFHAAATVRFNETLKSAVLLNTRGTREILEMSTKFKNIQIFVYVSTAFTNATNDNQTIEEKLYPPVDNWRQVIKTCERLSEDEIDLLTPHFIGSFPNTYTFTKNLAEHVVNDFSEKLPVVIVRPSIVFNAISEPVPGWTEGYNGLNAPGILVMHGMLSSVYVNDVLVSLIPVDVCVKSLIIAAWKHSYVKSNEMTIYNCTWDGKFNITYFQFMKYTQKYLIENPVKIMMKKPSYIFTKCKIYHCLRVFFGQLLLAMLVDFFSKNKKISLMKVQRKLLLSSQELKYFQWNNWKMQNDEFYELTRSITKSDHRDFSYEKSHLVDVDFYINNLVMGYRRFVIGDSDEVCEKARSKRAKLTVIDFLIKLTLIASVIFVIYLQYFK